jgi:hypothetical protein
MGGLITLAIALHAQPYTLGQGLHINPILNIGGYFSSEFESKNSDESFAIDDVAVMAYGEINPMFSYLGELEAVGFYRKNLSTGEESGSQTFHIERLYGDLWLSDAYNLRFGKMITPIGYWNTEPINVLRDTSSNPLYSRFLFPKFLTGIDLNGYIPGVDNVHYHLFAQNNRDLDAHYINIPNTHFFGLAVEKEFSMDWTGGGSVGEYMTLDHQRTRFIQANIKYDDAQWQMMSEVILAGNEFASNDQASTLSGYVQGMYRYTPEHAFVGRYEYYNDHHANYEDNIAVAGYSYRPWYPVSLKGEYQWHSLRDENTFLFSFSVLF